VAENQDSDTQTLLGAQRGRGAARWRFSRHPESTTYDVSAIDAAVESLGSAATKGDAPVRGNDSPRASRTLPHAGIFALDTPLRYAGLF
jgi:hypothetical protein